MTKKELQNISFEEVNEQQLKLNLIKYIEEYGFNKALYLLSIKNKLLLNSCNIDDNSFNQILFKNYIFHTNNKNEQIDLHITNNDQETINMFKSSIDNNNFEEAFKIFGNNYVVYQLLCILYMNEVNNTDLVKIDRIVKKYKFNFQKRKY